MTTEVKAKDDLHLVQYERLMKVFRDSYTGKLYERLSILVKRIFSELSIVAFQKDNWHTFYKCELTLSGRSIFHYKKYDCNGDQLYTLHLPKILKFNVCQVFNRIEFTDPNYAPYEDRTESSLVKNYYVWETVEFDEDEDSYHVTASNDYGLFVATNGGKKWQRRFPVEAFLYHLDGVQKETIPERGCTIM